jgi:hypothetical protein
MLDDAGEVSLRDLDDGRDAVAVRALKSRPDVVPRCVATDPHARPPTLRAVHLAPPNMRTVPCVRVPGVSLKRHIPGETLGRATRHTVPQRFRAPSGKRLTCVFPIRANCVSGRIVRTSRLTFPRRFRETLNWPFADALRQRS